MPNQPDEVELLRTYLATGKLMQVSTISSENKPWIVSVWYAQTQQLELIFSSNVAREHSKHIHDNQSVAGAVIAIELKGLGQKARGVTFSGSAHECAGQGLEEAYETYAARWPKALESFPLNKISSGESAMRMYRVTPTQYILFDEENFADQPKRVITKW